MTISKSKNGFFAIATTRTVAVRAVRVASVVGVVLAFLNHGDRLLSGHIDLATYLKIALTFLVPYCVSTYSSVLAVRESMQSVEGDRLPSKR
ncbi:hypothetical protein NBRC116601_13490 [Cognatishimia sp. WU-CL00825]|uniref:nitrate/nitrite transporter NrtS n=1 Tax=Cognatishimia sp. WU-CL00825 TaxID=3127658 RepID=UPI00310AF89E